MRHASRRRWPIHEPTLSASGSRILRAAAAPAWHPAAPSPPLQSGRLMAPGWPFEAIEPEPLTFTSGAQPAVESIARCCPWTRPVRRGLIPTDWSAEDQLLGVDRTICGCSPSGSDAKPAKFISSPASEMHGNFSPDGRLVAYTSNESGRFEIYVETVPRSDRKWPVSTNGGYEPRWRADGREIYYLSEDRTLMAVPVGAGPSFGIPTPLFQTHVPVGVTLVPHALRAEP